MSQTNPTITPADREAVVARYKAGASKRDIRREFGFATNTIRRILDAAGVEVRGRFEAIRHACKLPIRDDAFDVVTEHSAYWVGFLMADGCIMAPKGRPGISLKLAGCDAGHVEAFRDFLGSGCVVAIREERQPRTGKVHALARLQVYSDRLVAALARYGVLPRKSLDAEVIGLENNRDFWRGVIDGDGYISQGTRATGSYQPKLGLVGSRRLLEQFRDFAAGVSPKPTSKGGEHRAIVQHGKIFRFSVAGIQAARVITALYDGCTVALPRKLALAREVMARDVVRAIPRKVKLSQDDVREIRRRKLAGESAPALAAEFGVTRGAIYHALRGFTWQHID